MKHKNLLIWTGILLVFGLFIRFYAANSLRVEDGYSSGFYPPFASFLRMILGWLPISIGDIVYGIFVIWICWKLIKGIMALYNKRVNSQNFISGCLKTVNIFLVIYVFFNAFWGINYNRVGIAGQLQLKIKKYSIDDLKNLNGILLSKVNESKQVLVQQNIGYPLSKQIFVKVQEAYAVADSLYPFLNYQIRSLKPSLWGWLGNYLGFTGYYNPFTGEAQVNTGVPIFLQPFISCHEVAHQLGYAKEMEANFVGYLAAASSRDSLLHYSVYFEMFLYSNRNLFNIDSSAAKIFAKQLLPEVKADIKELREFYKRYKNPVEPVIRWFYGKYLENNEQPQGVLSYDEVTGFLIAYYKKLGRV